MPENPVFEYAEDQLRWGVQRLDAAGLARFKRLILSFEGGLKELSRETQERLRPQ